MARIARHLWARQKLSRAWLLEVPVVSEPVWHDHGPNDFLDADYKPDRDIIEKLLRGFQGPRVAAVQGFIEVENHKSSWLTKVIRLEWSTKKESGLTHDTFS